MTRIIGHIKNRSCPQLCQLCHSELKPKDLTRCNIYYDGSDNIDICDFCLQDLVLERLEK